MLPRIAEIPEEVRAMGVTDFEQTESGLFVTRCLPQPSIEHGQLKLPLEMARLLWPWTGATVLNAERVRALQGNVETFSAAAADLLERLTDLIEYMTDERPRNYPRQLEYTLHDGLKVLEGTWRQWYFDVTKPCKLHVVITVEVCHVPDFGVHPIWRYHVQNGGGTTHNLKELTHRVRELRTAQDRLNRKFELDTEAGGPPLRGIDL